MDPATVLFDEVVENGYQGGIAQLRRFVCQFKPSIVPEVVVRFETQPGQQMQIDFTSIRRGKKSLKAFVATLGYSRASYVKFFDNERAESWQQGLREAFDYFGGVPQEVLCDNAKSSSSNGMLMQKVIINYMSKCFKCRKITGLN
ncbi:Integrase core domain protein [Arsenophonus nasoniae]|uniref:Integrase core domain protein n=2 Tax=Arsenophonus nasoniae TaxID=638 RepID=A0A4P7KZB9_9GAMM|nr:Integrase core domain protein [Arsenophonus nasoniae]